MAVEGIKATKSIVTKNTTNKENLLIKDELIDIS